MCVYIFAGRFQPFHNGHMQVIQQLCEKMTPADTLVLGVVSPFMSDDVKDTSFLEHSQEHHRPERNPWDVSVPLSAISQIARSSPFASQIITTLLPRPEYGLQTIISWFPKKRVWVIPSAGEDFDEKKSDYFTKMGDKVIRFSDTTGISGRELRELYIKGDYHEFASNVPIGVADIYFKERPDSNAENDFQKRAKNYESHSRWVTDENVLAVPKVFLSSQERIGNLLDAGGGTGYLSWYLYKNLKNKIESISLVDISRNMLDEAEVKENYPVKIHNSSIETFCRMTAQKFDTILIRQVLHYVDDVNKVFSFLAQVLKNDGVVYVGQILVEDNECRDWHDELMQGISKNRRRTFVYNDFLQCFARMGFDVVRSELTDYNENLSILFDRRTNKFDGATLESLKSKMESLVTDSLKKKMSISSEGNDLCFTVKFCHLLLQKSTK